MKAKSLLVMISVTALTLPAVALGQQEKETRLEQVVVTASRYEEKTEKIPASVTVITAEDIQATTAQTVPEVLKEEAGIEVRDYYGNGRTTNVGLNGWGGETAGLNTLLLVDGRRVNEIDLSGVDWTQIPLDRVERIEIVRSGGAAVLYGDNAVGGVINIITKRGKPGTHFTAGGEYGSYQAHKEQAGFSVGKERLNLALNGSFTETDGYRTNNYFRNKSAGGSLSADLSDAVGLDLTGGIKSDRYGLPESLYQSDLDSGAYSRRDSKYPDAYAETDEYYLQITPRLDFLEWGKFQIGLIYKNKDASSHFTGTYLGSNYTSVDDKGIETFGCTPQYTRQDSFAGRTNVLTAGIDYYRYEMDQNTDFNQPSMTHTIDDNSFRKESVGYYLDDSFELLPALLALSLGYRQEMVHYDFDNEHKDLLYSSQSTVRAKVDHHLTAARAGLTLNYREGSKLFVSYARSFRTPAVDEYYTWWSGVDSTLLPEKNTHYDLGVEHALAPWFKAGLTLFRVDTRDEIFYDPVSFANTNYERTRRQGVELSFNAQVLDWLTFFGSYTYVKPELRQGSFPSGNDIPGIARHSASGGVNLSFLEYWRFDFRARWVGQHYTVSDWNNEGPKAPGWATADAKLTFHYGRLEGFVGVNNVFNKKYAEYTIYSGYRNELALYPSPELNAMVGLKYAF